MRRRLYDLMYTRDVIINEFHLGQELIFSSLDGRLLSKTQVTSGKMAALSG
jgi:hypothetical protein